MKIAMIVEGKGDVGAGPALVARTARAFGEHVFACEPVIRSGEARKLSRQGELERFLRLAALRDDADEVLLLLDLDDDCAKEYSDQFNERAKKIEEETGKKINICFCVREFEAWFLADIETLRVALPEYGISQNVQINNPATIRPAKETLKRCCRSKGYKQTRDQTIFAKKIDIKRLAAADRSFRKLVKAITKKTYVEILDECALR